jgi:hypothetical protein
MVDIRAAASGLFFKNQAVFTIWVCSFSCFSEVGSSVGWSIFEEETGITGSLGRPWWGWRSGPAGDPDQKE